VGGSWAGFLRMSGAATGTISAKADLVGPTVVCDRSIGRFMDKAPLRAWVDNEVIYTISDSAEGLVRALDLGGCRVPVMAGTAGIGYHGPIGRGDPRGQVSNWLAVRPL